MGNTVGCSASGERLLTAARDGDVVEVRMLLALSPGLARYSTFAGLNSPLHFAAAKGHAEIVMLLLENGAEVNSRNYCGQTALMQACRYGHWEVVQTLLLFRSNVTRADCLSSRTALHFAAAEGHVRCIRLLVADFVPSIPYEAITAPVNGEEGASKSSSYNSSSEHKMDKVALMKFINRPADGGITALHMAVLNGHFDCVQLLLDLHANVSAVTFHWGSSLNLVGAGSTPLHYAACGGNLKCCQILLARGASRLTLNCNGWLPLDVARMWGRHWLEPLLSPRSKLTIPTFPPSSYLSLPLMSILDIARECKLQSSIVASDDSDLCAVCLERACTVSAEGCGHELCVKCALYLCSAVNIKSDPGGPPGSVPCPLCRSGIVSFVKLPSTPVKEVKPNLAFRICNPCILYAHDVDLPTTSNQSEVKDCSAGDPSDHTGPLPCSTSHSAGILTCISTDDPCLPTNPQGVVLDHSQNASDEPENSGEERVEKSICSNMFWNQRSCHREHQCNSEINS